MSPRSLFAPIVAVILGAPLQAQEPPAVDLDTPRAGWRCTPAGELTLVASFVYP